MKAYDFNVLLEKLKGQGVELGEEAAKVVIKALVEWLKESAALSENKIDDLAALGLPELEKLALSLADDINKADNAPSA